MNTDIKNWLDHINKTSKKRKRNDDNEYILNELTYNSIESLIEILTEDNIKANELDDFLETMGFIFNGTKQVFENEWP